MKNFAAKLVLVLLLGALQPAIAREELVLIVSAKSGIQELDSPAVRKLFLGLTVTQGGIRPHAALNTANPQIKELFLQNIVSMSDSTYDRYLLRSLLQGRTQPQAYSNEKELVDAVAADPTLVSYVWATDVAHDPRIRTLRVLWHD